MQNIRLFLNKLKAHDLVVIVFYLFLILVNLIFYKKIDQWQLFILMNTAIIIFALLLGYLEEKHNNVLVRITHYWYIAPLILITFKELYFLIKPIRVYDYDYLLIAADRWLFGGDPTHFLHNFANPVLTEILQIVYSSFYLLPVILGLALLRKKKFLATEYAVFSVVYGFYLSYLGYFALPGIGPRFTLHNFDTINIELPGLWLTNYIRDFLNAGESIPAGTLNPAEVVQRDIFPSGHTMITLIVIYLSIKLKSRSRFFLVPVGSLLVFSTVYLWYHYFIDLVGGLLFMMFSLWSGRIIFNKWQRFTGKEEFNYRLTPDEPKHKLH
jgi:membrane-associated phospholipid phosphatase